MTKPTPPRTTPHLYARAGAVAGFETGRKLMELPVEKRTDARLRARKAYLQDGFLHDDGASDDEVKLCGDAYEMAINEFLRAAAENRAVQPIMIDGVAVTPETPLRY